MRPVSTLRLHEEFKQRQQQLIQKKLERKVAMPLKKLVEISIISHKFSTAMEFFFLTI